ncbi:MAG: hypothetical protein CMJ40_07530 [Phycisphaerae bacterium]|nr:hypothetical protein [Phycisphaerae bacterium]|tara:strand:- start:2527 stop:2907 length:381 start_codon:yes stop_codon:yes gene_type:complete
MNGKLIRHFRTLNICGLGLLVCGMAGCHSGHKSSSHVSEPIASQVAAPLVMPSAQTLEVLGPEGLISNEMHAMNLRKDVLLGADLPPVAVPVNLSQVYIRDQQWILNGRPWENYLQTTRSLQLKSR